MKGFKVIYQVTKTKIDYAEAFDSEEVIKSLQDFYSEDSIQVISIEELYNGENE